MQEKGIIEQSNPYASPHKQKQHYVSPLILGHPDFNNPFIVYTDASNMCLSDVFSQQTGLHGYGTGPRLLTVVWALDK